MQLFQLLLINLKKLLLLLLLKKNTVESADKNDKVGENDNIDVNAPTVEIIKEEKPAEAIDMVDKVQIPSNEVSLQDENGCESAAAVNLDDISDKVEKSVDADKKEEEMIVEIVGASTVTADRAETIGVKVEEIKSADKNDKVEEIGNIDDVNAPTVEVVKEEKPAVAIVIVDKVQLPSNEVSLQDENGCKSAAAVNLDEKSVDADKHEEEMLVEG
uniref:Uncharacterized protein n=1 Tax=Panagrolaimus superbus TaxID=310955 RepID=A0A914YVM5_9BILA